MTALPAVRAVTLPAVARGRVAGLDAIRGLAVACMVVDHVALLAGQDWLRLTVGRLAMPLFFVLAGHLFRRLSDRHWQAAALGLLLPVLVPWVDSPNVLLLWAVGSVLLALRVPPALLAVTGLSLAANGWGLHFGTAFDVAALVGLMGVGAVLPRAAFGWGSRLPAWLSRVGRYPLSIYVGHLLVLRSVQVWFLA